MWELNQVGCVLGFKGDFHGERLSCADPKFNQRFGYNAQRYSTVIRMRVGVSGGNGLPER